MKAFMTRDTAPVSKKATNAHTNSGLPALIDNYGPAFNDLVTILSMRRQSGSRGEARLVAWLQTQYPELQKDGYGNLFLRIGTSPIMFTAHTDTVHYGEKFTIEQDIGYDATTNLLFTLGDNVLGADDGAGVWLLMQMINTGTPGLYYFFRDEEVGGLGSSWVAKHALENLDGIQAIISFDRKGTGDVIATQRGKDCSSKTFRDELMYRLTDNEWLTYDAHASGSFTDSANFMDIVEECTNLSIGYEHAHTSSETLDVEHLSRLAVQLTENVDWDAVADAIDRNPTVKEEPKLPTPGPINQGYNPGYGMRYEPAYTPAYEEEDILNDDFNLYARSDIDSAKSIVELVEDHPQVIADLLEEYGFELGTLKDMLCATYGFDAPKRARLC